MQPAIIKKSKKGNLPNLIIIGAVKCATTSLHYYLGLHPEISMSREKELDFFVRERNWQKGIEWYKSNFTGKGIIYGEASPSYTTYPFYKGMPERMYSVVPEVKLIYCLRDPVDRIISHYVHNLSEGTEDRTIEEALSHLDRNLYVNISKYYMQLEQYLKCFPKSNIYIIILEDLYDNRRLTLQKIFRFLNVDDTFYSPKVFSIRHKSIEKRRKNRIGLLLKRLSETNAAKMFLVETRRKIGSVLYLPFSSKIERPKLDENLQGKLIEHLSDDINHLREFAGRNFMAWRV
ncbi:MAG: sulfotransferase [Desulfobacteraceae bacterium]|nr:sulfotransferase [Desulfobacteraceae bacterium]